MSISKRILVIGGLAVATAQLLVRAQSSLTLDKKVLSLAAARKIVTAAEAEATRRGLGVTTQPGATPPETAGPAARV